MDESLPADHVVRFQGFELNLRTGELRKSGTRIRLQEQPFKVLAALLERPGQLVTREELRKRIWPEENFGDFDHAINLAVGKLRGTLGDSADVPHLIETLTRRGYRFIAPIEKAASDRSQQPVAIAKETIRGKRSRWWAVSGGFLVVLAGILIWRSYGKVPEELASRVEIVPLAAGPGNEYTPVFSPDGKQVAFAVNGKNDSGIYTTLVGGEKPLRLSSDPSSCCPTWSPDGKEVAFARFSGGEVAIYVVSALGGTERRLYTGPASEFPQTMDWSPDGRFIAISRSDPDRTHCRIELLSRADQSLKQLTSPSSQELDYAPAFSPDGMKVAFVRGSVTGMISDVFTVPLEGGEVKRVTFDNRGIFCQLAWTADSAEIVFSSDRAGGQTLWRVPASGGSPRLVAGVGTPTGSPTISRRGRQLAYQHDVVRYSIQRVDLRDKEHPQGPALPVIEEKRRCGRPDFSPDGSKIAFESDRLGYSDIWVCGNDGSNCQQVTSLHGVAGAARWSPNGRFLAFEYRPKEHSEVYLVEVPDGVPRLLTTLRGADNGGPNWSRDGNWIYFYSDQGGGPLQLWKVSVAGGTPVQITKNGGVFAAESEDGRILYYSKFGVPGIWKMPIEGGEEVRVLDEAIAWDNWRLSRGGIYFVESTGQNSRIQYFDVATGKKTPVYTLDKDSDGFALSPDGKSALYAQTDFVESSVILMKNFQ